MSMVKFKPATTVFIPSPILADYFTKVHCIQKIYRLSTINKTYYKSNLKKAKMLVLRFGLL